MPWGFVGFVGFVDDFVHVKNRFYIRIDSKIASRDLTDEIRKHIKTPTTPTKPPPQIVHALDPLLSKGFS